MNSMNPPNARTLKHVLRLAVAATVLIGSRAPAQQDVPPYLDTNLSFEERTRDLMSRLSLEEKAQLLNHRGTTVRVEETEIISDEWNQALHGVVWDRPTTMFPVSIAMAATWDPELVRREATVISDEARAVNNLYLQDPGSYRGQRKGLIYRAPVINIERNPYWGRNEEAYSEDPYLTGRIGVAYVQGLQGDDPRYLKLVSTLKHYAVNNVEQSRQSLSAEVSERMLHEYWLPHFRDCIVEGRAQSVMASYNAINGTPNNINYNLLTEILKDRWGFEGFVVSDLGGVRTMVRGHEGGQMSYEEAVGRSLMAGCDFSDREFEQYIPRAIEQGFVTTERVNDALYRVLYNRFRLGEFDPPEMVPYRQIAPDIIASPQHRELALEAAQKAIVLLSNKNGVLPLDKSSLTSIAVIGPQADQFISGGYSGRPQDPVTPLAGMRNRAGEGIEILYSQGTSTEQSSIVVEDDAAFSGGQSVKLESFAAMEHIEFPVEIPQAGTYEITLRYKAFPSRGVFQLSIDGEDQGRTVDMFAPGADFDRTVSFGENEFDSAGVKQFRFTVVGHNERSSSYTGHFDQIALSGPADVNLELEDLEYKLGVPEDAGPFTEAVAAARRADAAIVYVGTNNSHEREGRDRDSLSLPGAQEGLVRAVVAANPNTVVVFMNAGPISEPWIKENAPAVLEAWWLGVEGGNAIADVIFGDVNPGGRLPHTVYASEDQVPPQDEYDVTKGFTYMYLEGEPLYAFGHGLSYTEFEYSNLRLSDEEIAADGRLTVSIDVQNVGDRAGDEVVQLYVHDVEASVVRPTKELRGFRRITLAPGEKQTVELPLRGDQLAFWDEEVAHDFVVEPGAFEVMVGGSSADIRAAARFDVAE